MVVRFVYYEYDYGPNWTTRSSVTYSVTYSYLYISGFLKSKHKKFREFFASREEKKPFKRAHDGAYCPISAEISTIDSQSELRILLWL